MIKLVDSVRREELLMQLKSLRTTDNLKREELEIQIQNLSDKDEKSAASKKARTDSLRNIFKGYPVMGVHNDTLFEIYSKIGSFRPQERAASITAKIKKLYDDDFLKIDSIFRYPQRAL
jgi:hypothetical protein